MTLLKNLPTPLDSGNSIETAPRTLALTSLLITAASLFSTIISIVTGLVMVRLLLPGQYGEFAYFLRVFAIGRFLGNLGLGAKIISDLSHSQSVGTPQDTLRILTNTLSIRLLSSSGVALALVVLGWATSDHVLLWAGLVSFVAALADYLNASSQGLRRRTIVIIATIAQPLAFLIFIALLSLIYSVAEPRLTDAVYLAYAFSFLIILVSYAVALRQFLRGTHLHFLSHTYLLNLIKPMLALFMAALLSVLYDTWSTIMLGQFKLFHAAAYFSIPYSLVSMFGSLALALITTVFYPELIQRLSKRQTDGAAALLDQFLLYAAVPLILLAAGLAVYADILIPQVYTARYIPAIPTTILVSPLLALFFLQSLLIFSLYAAERYAVVARVWLLELALLGIGILITRAAIAPQALPTLTSAVIPPSAQGLALWSNESALVATRVALAQVVSTVVGFLVFWGYTKRLYRFNLSLIQLGLLFVLAVGSALLARSVLDVLLTFHTLVSAVIGGIIALFIYIPAIMLLVLNRAQRGTLLALVRLTYQSIGHSIGQITHRTAPTAKTLIVLVSVGLLIGMQVQLSRAQANSGETDTEPLCSLSELESQRDGNRLRCPFAGNPQDVITVYPHDAEDQSIDFINETWVFDARGDGRANLIIVFTAEENRLIAEFYDDQDDDRQVAYVVEGENVTVTESANPIIEIAATDGWWVRQSDGVVNYNLLITVDGLTRAMFGVGQLEDDGVWESNLPAAWFPRMSDNRNDYEIRVYDTNRDGRPDSQLARNLLPLSNSSGVHRAELIANSQLDETPPQEGSIYFPYLGGVNSFIQDYGESPAPVQVNWDLSRVWQVSEFVASRGNDHNWFIYSILPFELEQTNRANFENPFTFYDLADDHDGRPELQIRSEYFPALDSFNIFGGLSVPTTSIRYSVDQDNNGEWDYKLALASPHEISGLIEFPDFAVETIPYEDFPYWVTDNTWGYVAFVAAENRTYTSTEGIYEWAATDAMIAYLAGRQNLFPSRFMDDPENTPPGLRGEYRTTEAQPRLYLSAIDHRLHLLGAQRGVWNVDGSHFVHYENLDDDPILDRWVYSENNTVQAQVIDAGNYFFYTQDGEGIITLFNPDEIGNRAVFETMPPRNHEEWSQLGARLEANYAQTPTDDIGQIIAQFGEPVTMIDGASLEHFRLTDDGFRFELTLQPDYRMDGENLFDGSPSPGRYAVTYSQSGDQFALNIATAPSVSIETVEVVSADSLSTYQSALLRVGLHNESNTDIDLLNVTLVASQNGTAERLLPVVRSGPDVALNAESTVEREFLWTPSTPGNWVIYGNAEILSNEGEVLQTIPFEQALDVTTPPPVDTTFLMTALGLVPAWVVLLLWAALACAIAATFLLIVRQSNKT